jgi:hypothetical protein
MTNAFTNASMPNDATVGDWLGTAATAATVAAAHLDAIRAGKSAFPDSLLNVARDRLAQALGEVDAIRAEVRP